MKFNTQYSRKQDKPESNSGVSIVEKDGYMPADKKILSMMYAGERYMSFTPEQADFPDGKIDEDAVNMTTRKGFDKLTASMVLLDRGNRYEDAMKRSHEAFKAKKEVNNELGKGESDLDSSRKDTDVHPNPSGESNDISEK